MDLRILDINKINIYQISIYMFKSLHNLFPSKPDNYTINSEIHSHDTRLTTKIHIEHSRTKISQFAIKNYGPNIWNSLPPEINEIPNINIFKKKLKLYLITI